MFAVPTFILDSNNYRFVKYFKNRAESERNSDLQCIPWCSETCQCTLLDSSSSRLQNEIENKNESLYKANSNSRSPIKVICWSPLSACDSVTANNQKVICQSIVVVFIDFTFPYENIIENVIRKKIYKKLILVTIETQEKEKNLLVKSLPTNDPGFCHLMLQGNNALNFELISIYIANVIKIYNNEACSGKRFACRKETANLYDPFDQFTAKCKIKAPVATCECYKFV